MLGTRDTWKWPLRLVRQKSSCFCSLKGISNLKWAGIIVIAALTEGDIHGSVGLFTDKHDSRPVLPTELSAVVGKFYVGAMQYGSQWPHMTIEHLATVSSVTKGMDI